MDMGKRGLQFWIMGIVSLVSLRTHRSGKRTRQILRYFYACPLAGVD